jgi:hypothetical protein
VNQLRCVLSMVLLTGLVLSLGCSQSDDTTTLPAGTNPRALVVAVLEVDIDILPHNADNRLNCGAVDRVFPVAILSEGVPDGFEATDVDHTTVTFEEASEVHVDPQTGLPKRHEEDVNGDGYIDLVFHFRYGDTDLDWTATEGKLVGSLFSGEAIEGTDEVELFEGKKVQKKVKKKKK